MSSRDFVRFGEMKMFMHHIYEYKKGVRDLILCTMCRTCAELVTERLRRQQIEYLAQDIDGQRVNLYFGKRACLDAVRMFIDKLLNRLTPEEDFMLGTMLGYDIPMLCERFCNRKRTLAAGYDVNIWRAELLRSIVDLCFCVGWTGVPVGTPVPFFGGGAKKSCLGRALRHRF